MRLPLPLCVALETAINQYLRLDPPSIARLAALTGKVIAIELSGSELTIYLAFEPESVRLPADFAGVPDARLRGGPVSLLRSASARHTPLAARGIEVSGDVETARRFKSLLDGVDIDWEEHLSRLVGDVIAHQLGNLVRGAWRWGTQAVTTLAQDTSEYLKEESRNLPSRYEVEEFLQQVDTLRADADRLAQRVTRLTVSRE